MVVGVVAFAGYYRLVVVGILFRHPLFVVAVVAVAAAAVAAAAATAAWKRSLLLVAVVDYYWLVVGRLFRHPVAAAVATVA